MHFPLVVIVLLRGGRGAEGLGRHCERADVRWDPHSLLRHSRACVWPAFVWRAHYWPSFSTWQGFFMHISSKPSCRMHTSKQVTHQHSFAQMWTKVYAYFWCKQKYPICRSLMPITILRAKAKSRSLTHTHTHTPHVIRMSHVCYITQFKNVLYLFTVNIQLVVPQIGTNTGYYKYIYSDLKICIYTYFISSLTIRCTFVYQRPTHVSVFIQKQVLGFTFT